MSDKQIINDTQAVGAWCYVDHACKVYLKLVAKRDQGKDLEFLIDPMTIDDTVDDLALWMNIADHLAEGPDLKREVTQAAVSYRAMGDDERKEHMEDFMWRIINATERDIPENRWVGANS